MSTIRFQIVFMSTIGFQLCLGKSDWVSNCVYEGQLDFKLRLGGPVGFQIAFMKPN